MAALGRKKPSDGAQAALRLPRVDAVTNLLGAEEPRALRVEAARRAIADARARLLSGGPAPTAEQVAIAARAWLEGRARPTLQRVINATGVVVHTNLGRAPLPVEAIASGLGYCNLELDLATGERGSRHDLLAPLLIELGRAEAALVVNNCAAALVLALTSLARPATATGGAPEAIVSRGELVEIGGSFRIPEILACAGVSLREVGTTNRTYVADYAQAIGPDTVAILRVHRSNFTISGFVSRPTLSELAALCQTAAIPFLVDLGSDAMASVPALAPLVSPLDDTLIGALQAGATAVTFSGDKLLGGPQSGIVLGQRAALDRMARHPLMRALRPDKLALAALEYVLRARASGTPERVPVLQMLSLDRTQLRVRAARIAALLAARGLEAAIVDTEDPIGGGSHPEATLPGAGLALTAPAGRSIGGWHAALRRAHPPVIATLHKNRLVMALRTVSEADEPDLVQAIITSLDTPASLI